jgi:two-component system osmolarity sensor histidine kinase EnvZ
LRLALELQPGLARGEREAMVADVEEMDAIVGQFLDFVRDGRDEPEETVELGAMLRELAEAAARDGCEWSLSVPEDISIRGRAMALRRALRNLMRNAQIHGAAPRRLFVQGIPAGEGAPARVAICVRDQGPGLPASVLERIGQPFVRSTPSRAGAPGSGLGLSLVQRVARMHGGELGVSTLADGGFEARLTLPLAAVAD